MSTTIDSLQIEIQTSSTNAARGIDALASSLERLKQNGSFKTVSNNLNNLSVALRNLPNVHQASNALRTLANSIEKLKGIGSVSSIATGLNKLPAALRALSSINIENLAPQIQRIATAFGPLSALKAGGLGSMVSSLSKLGAVTKSLDDEAIDAFAERVKKLNSVLEPLSAKMAGLKTGFSSINSKANSAGTAVQTFDNKVHVSTFNLSNMVNVMTTLVYSIQRVVQAFSSLIAEAIEWDGIAARFNRGFGSEAKGTYEWIQRLNEEMGINVQQFMQYSSIYATMLTGFGVANEDATKMALGYTELTYDIWAGYNDVYKSFAEASEAVKSAIAGEVEPIRRAGFTIIESTLEQVAANHGLEISLANATEAQKSYLRYLALVEQAHSQNLVGTYAKELTTAEGLMRTFAQQLKSLTQAFGSLFLPILVRIMPYMQAFVELLTEGVNILAGFFGFEIQEVSWDGYNSGVSDAVQNTENVAGALDDAATAAKELKNATLGIDELNVISPPSSSGSGGGAGGAGGGTGFDGLDVDSLWDESLFKHINSQVDEIKEKLKGWIPIVETLGAIFGTLGLATLLASIGESMVELKKMEGLVGTLKRSLAGLAILTIEAVLVFALSDSYLETGSLMSLLGEALATAAGGFLMYKGFGPKGLVMSLAVSMAAQLVAITMNLADGGVEMSDPQLWIQSAFTTAIGGVAGGILAYKGLIPFSKGKGVGIGVLAGLSLTLAAITIGDVIANGEVTEASVLTGIGSVLAAAGFGFTVGGAWGAVIGAVAGLAINIGGAVIGTISKNAETSLEDDLKSRFGKITLDNETLEVFVDKITAIPRKVEIDGNTMSVDAALNVFVSEVKALDNFEEAVYKHLEKLDRLNVKIAVGVDVTEAEYTNQINSFLESAQGYLEQHYLTTSIAINILENGSSGNLSNVLSSFYKINSGKLAELGSQLKEAVSGAFVDGEWIPDKLQEAVELQQEIQEILDYVSNVEYRATMENLSLSISGDALTADSFKDVLSGAKEAIESRLEALEEVKMSQLQVAIMEYDANIAAGVSEAEAKKIYETTVADIEEAYQNGKVEVTFGTIEFGLQTIQDAFAEELAIAESKGWLDFGSQLEDALGLMGKDIWKPSDDSYAPNLAVLISHIGTEYEAAVGHLSKKARKNLEELLKAMKPTVSDYEEIATASRKAGTTVSEEIRSGLNDYNELAALSGDVDAINYLIGQGFSTDTAFLNTLATAKDAGKNIDKSAAEGLLNNITYVTDEATGVVTGIKNSITGEVIAVTPILKENMEHMGVDLSTGLASGVEKDKPTLLEKISGWANGVVDWCKKLFGIHSPSTVMRDKIGKPLSQGVAEGMESNSIKNKLSTMWSTAKTWWDKKGTLKTYTPSIGSIYEKVKERWDSARTWWNEKKTAMKTYTPSIGSIYEKAKERWDNARVWWNSKKTAMKSYTPSIGSIKDKISSAWNTAKNWWNKNAKLSTKLNVSVPKIKVNWDTASAFGKEFRYPTGFKLTFAANGGIFDQGSLIWAGERGPEVMATAAGGRTGVMNVQQMQDAVYEGVYAAVSAAMRGNGGEGGSQAVNVYLDGKQITTAVEKRQRERGASIMGNAVYSF